MSFRHKTQEILLPIYKEKGIEYTMELCDLLQKEATDKKVPIGKEKLSMIRGKLCEVVLEILVLEYIRKNNLKDWFCIPSLYLRDVFTKNTAFYSEVDLVIFTPSRLMLFECKNYGGEKTFVDQGTIKRAGIRHDANVYDQHEKHLEAFVSIFEPFKDKKVNNGYFMGYFNYSSGSLKDVREDKWKKAFPVVDRDNLYSYLDKAKESTRIWNMDEVRKVVKMLEKNKEKVARKHLNYVTGLHPRK